MSPGAVRAGVAIFAIGLLFVWLLRPIGDACPDVDKLPSGSSGESAPSFAPPLTRTCTYSTPEGAQARTRYVPVLDLVVVALVAGVGGAAIGLAGPGRRRPLPPRAPKPRRPHARAAASIDEGRSERGTGGHERDAAQRERARRERDARRRG